MGHLAHVEHQEHQIKEGHQHEFQHVQGGAEQDFDQILGGQVQCINYRLAFARRHVVDEARKFLAIFRPVFAEFHRGIVRDGAQTGEQGDYHNQQQRVAQPVGDAVTVQEIRRWANGVEQEYADQQRLQNWPGVGYRRRGDNGGDDDQSHGVGFGAPGWV